jgi:hypothetical protein
MLSPWPMAAGRNEFGLKSGAGSIAQGLSGHPGAWSWHSNF